MKLIGKNSHLVAGAAVVAVVFAAGALTPQWRRLRSLELRTRLMREQIEQSQLRMQSAANTFDRVTEARRRAPVFEAAIPKADELGVFLEQVSRIADQLELADRDMTPAREQACRNTAVLPIKMSFRGTFDAVYAFITQLESMPRVARIQQLLLDVVEPRTGQLRSTMTVFVYYENS